MRFMSRGASLRRGEAICEWSSLGFLLPRCREEILRTCREIRYPGESAAPYCDLSPEAEALECRIGIAEEKLRASRDGTNGAKEEAIALDYLLQVRINRVVDEPAEAGGD